MGIFTDALNQIRYRDVLYPDESGLYGVAPKRPLDQYTLDEFYDSFMETETGGIANPWIRTKYAPAEGSSAYGPVQITKGLLTDTLTGKYGNPDFFKGSGVEQYVKEYMDQADKFLYHGSMKGKIPDYNPIYDYGGPGHLTSDQNKKDYRTMAKMLMEAEWNRAKKTKQPIENLIKYWRWGTGDAPTMDRGDDPRYFKDFHGTLRKGMLTSP